MPSPLRSLDAGRASLWVRGLWLLPQRWFGDKENKRLSPPKKVGLGNCSWQGPWGSLEKAVAILSPPLENKLVFLPFPGAFPGWLSPQITVGSFLSPAE